MMVATSQPSSWTKEIPLVLKFYLKAREAVKRLRTDTDGVISFEYVIVAACIVGTVAAAFGGAGAGTIQGALTAGFAVIGGALVAAV
jgi:pilus assembly protein Flp/PilA